MQSAASDDTQESSKQHAKTKDTVGGCQHVPTKVGFARLQCRNYIGQRGAMSATRQVPAPSLEALSYSTHLYLGQEQFRVPGGVQTGGREF